MIIVCLIILKWKKGSAESRDTRLLLRKKGLCRCIFWKWYFSKVRLQLGHDYLYLIEAVLQFLTCSLNVPFPALVLSTPL